MLGFGAISQLPIGATQPLNSASSLTIGLTQQKITGTPGRLGTGRTLVQNMLRNRSAATIPHGTGKTLVQDKITGTPGTIVANTGSPAINVTLAHTTATFSQHPPVATNSLSLALAHTAGTFSQHPPVASVASGVNVTLSQHKITGTPGTITATNALSVALAHTHGTWTPGAVSSGAGLHVTLVGVSAAWSAHKPVVGLITPLAGAHITGTPGTVSAAKVLSVALTQQKITGTPGAIKPGLAFTLTQQPGAWSARAPDVESASHISVHLSGQRLAGSIGSIVVGISHGLSQQHVTSHAGVIGRGFGLHGESVAITPGRVGVTLDINVGGLRATFFTNILRLGPQGGPAVLITSAVEQVLAKPDQLERFIVPGRDDTAIITVQQLSFVTTNAENLLVQSDPATYLHT